jgi:formate dehydrogenase subunit gamma
MQHAVDIDAAVDAAIAEHLGRPGALMPIMHAVQERLGYVPDDSVPRIAKALNLSRAEVHGFLTFYHWFRRHPVGRHVVHVCRAEACQALGGREVEARFKKQLGCDYHETSADGAVSLEPVYCLGHCARGPSALIDNEPVAALDVAQVDELIASLRSAHA